jgi:Fic family protein
MKPPPITSDERIIQAKLKELRGMVEAREQIQVRITKTEALIKAMIDLLEEDITQTIYIMRLQEEIKPRGLTETVKRVLRQAGRLTPQGVREKLEEEGFPLAGYASALSVIYTTLNRLTEQGLVNKKIHGEFEWIAPAPTARGRYARIARPSDVPIHNDLKIETEIGESKSIDRPEE